jgi:hypothetical protein
VGGSFMGMRSMFYDLMRKALKAMLPIMIGVLGTFSCDAATVTLAWDPSPATDAANYKVYVGPTSDNYTNSISVGLVTSASIPGLVAGGTYYFAATVTDSAGLESAFSSEISYNVPVVMPNQPPTLNALANIAIPQNVGLQSVNLSGITSGATNQVQTLVVTAASSNPALIPNPSISYSSPGTTGTLRFQPVAGAAGTATITVMVNNGGLSNNIVSRSFTVVVDQAPTISTIANVTIGVNSQTAAIPFTIADAQVATSNLTVTATSSNVSLVGSPNVFFGGSDANRTVIIKPVAGQTGNCSITLTVSDSVASASTTFQLSVMPRPSPPTNIRIAML